MYASGMRTSSCTAGAPPPLSTALCTSTENTLRSGSLFVAMVASASTTLTLSAASKIAAKRTTSGRTISFMTSRPVAEARRFAAFRAALRARLYCARARSYDWHARLQRLLSAANDASSSCSRSSSSSAALSSSLATGLRGSISSTSFAMLSRSGLASSRLDVRSSIARTTHRLLLSSVTESSSDCCRCLSRFATFFWCPLTSASRHTLLGTSTSPYAMRTIPANSPKKLESPMHSPGSAPTVTLFMRIMATSPTTPATAVIP
mmetsp:Transcript_4945/g.12403  ORF Transcript_4945/g.12403 Transcript_4945/m.12403 type:complete len:263 (+) Transcript_4945:675-1463(+)